MASLFQQRSLMKISNRSAALIRPRLIQTISPIRLISSQSEVRTSKSKLSGPITAFGLLGILGVVGLAFGASAKSQQHTLKLEKNKVVISTEENPGSESIEEISSEPGKESEDSSSTQQSAFNPETGEINWDCPCLGGMAHGVCGEQFKAAFGCFVYSEAEPKGVECIDKFKLMQDCFREHPDIYGEELIGQEEDQQSNEEQISNEIEDDNSRTLSSPTTFSKLENSSNLAIPSSTTDTHSSNSKLPISDSTSLTNRPSADT
ncbi:hypothetical protein CROQUDRAFT_87354 [Cronartium quercuum f. sp. fusiforme G11]|uniref:Mitochondrial intermembrane space import and assembly protein 40 n=1 Tax=Cronartium quercuum f. sp. fusiforme G11 TaxID=708437 RepID=A0A9P6NVE9_9BASI|nr:hypothetical protein CROQUDRAFT_87354 [Cronartium quercuum f. sp. fusiforme G11]